MLPVFGLVMTEGRSSEDEELAGNGADKEKEEKIEEGEEEEEEVGEEAEEIGDEECRVVDAEANETADKSPSLRANT